MCTEIEARWRAYWQGRGAGYDDGETYDRYVRHATRVPLAQVLTEHPTAGEDPHAVEFECHLSAEVTEPHPDRRHPC